jgi:small subunit ribosomal protein S3
MAIERKFIRKSIADHEVREFIKKEMERAGVSQVILQKTPMATRIIIYVRRPGIVVGKRGSSIKELCDKLTARFGVENPQLDVVEVEKPELNAALMAEKVGKQIELRGNIKQTMRFSLKEIMSAGALGAEIRVAGKVIGKGGKAKALKQSAGHLKKSGDLVNMVSEGRYTCFLKAGTIGVQVRIVPPDVKFPDMVDYEEVNRKLAELQAAPVEGAGEPAGAGEEQAEGLEEKIEEKIAEAKVAAEKPAEAAQKAKKKTPREGKEAQAKPEKEAAGAAEQKKSKKASPTSPLMEQKKAEKNEDPGKTEKETAGETKEPKNKAAIENENGNAGAAKA